ncbi:MAG: N-acetyl-gamma-glutamyl-phosphate reductase [Desulfovibrionaceae bacterium]|nr:N-acetyl-gamma-glutamyl-phosphate reductase [Desulfovibrionaceae bacterium]
MTTINVGLVGITGYAGMELARLLVGHPNFRLTVACSRAEAGKKLSDYYPFLQNFKTGELTITQFSPEEVASKCEMVFLAVPAGTAMKMVPELLAKHLKVIDFSADFRLKDKKVYEDWYALTHEAPELLKKAVYGLPELYAEQIKGANLIANPGCYPTSILLGLSAALKHNLILTDDILIDSKSGATGAGRKPSVPNLFCEVSDNFRAYGLAKHRHTPEIEQEVGFIIGQEVTLQFSPHLIPMNRGILSTIYAKLKKPLEAQEVHDYFTATWQGEPWIRVLPLGKLPETRFVRGTMFCDLGLVVDPRTQRLIIVSTIDNLCRGAAGQALANANLMQGLSVDTGLNQAPLV